MKKQDVKELSENINANKLYKTVIFISSIILGVNFLIVFGIIFNSENISFLNCDFSEKGWSLFVQTFEVPLNFLWHYILTFSMFAAFITIHQFEKQYRQYRHQIAMSNYFKHKGEFVKYIKALTCYINNKLNNDNLVKYITPATITDYEYNELYICWYGNDFHGENRHKITENINDALFGYYSNILKCKTESCFVKEELSDKIIKSLRFDIFSGFNDNRDDINKCIAIAFLCTEILKFSNDKIENDCSENMSTLVQTHLEKIIIKESIH